MRLKARYEARNAKTSHVPKWPSSSSGNRMDVSISGLPVQMASLILSPRRCCYTGVGIGDLIGPGACTNPHKGPVGFSVFSNSAAGMRVAGCVKEQTSKQSFCHFRLFDMSPRSQEMCLKPHNRTRSAGLDIVISGFSNANFASEKTKRQTSVSE